MNYLNQKLKNKIQTIIQIHKLILWCKWLIKLIVEWLNLSLDHNYFQILSLIIIQNRHILLLKIPILTRIYQILCHPLKEDKPYLKDKIIQQFKAQIIQIHQTYNNISIHLQHFPHKKNHHLNLNLNLNLNHNHNHKNLKLHAINNLSILYLIIWQINKLKVSFIGIHWRN